MRHVALCVSLLLPSGLAGQVGSTTDIITGVVRTDQGTPIAEAVVEVISIETELSRAGRTNGQGRYLIVFPDGGGAYRVVIRAIGHIPVERLLARVADEDRLVLNVAMVAVGGGQRLDEVVVRGRNGPPVLPNGPTPGSTERTLTPEQVSRLPIEASDLNILATLAPGVVAIDGTDTSAAAFSVAGQRPTANNITLDGLSFGSGQVPQEAVRNTRVITNSYDAARGQFSGGQIASTTRGGTNIIQGTSNYSLRDRDLELAGSGDESFNRGFTQHQLSGGFGGPIIRNKLLVFGSLSGRLRTDDLQTLLNASSATLDRLGTSPDSSARFLGILGSVGIPTQLGLADNRESDNYSALSRVDWNISDAHTLTLRGDWRRSTQDPSRLGTLALPQTGGQQVSNSGGAALTVTSRFGIGLINEFKGYLSRSEQTSIGMLTIPQGRVQVTSTLADGSQGVSSLVFGGNPSLPTRNTTTSFEASNETSWLPGNGGHRIKLGGLFNGAWIDQAVSSNEFGSFAFNSLADLEAGRPASFTRTLTPTIRSATSLNGAVYLADTWRHSAALQFTLGARLEYSGADGVPAYNPEVETLFGRRTDRLPSDVHFSPRVGFTFLPGANSTGGPRPSVVIRGGIGNFRSPIPTNLIASAQSATGLSTETQLVCIGAAAPTPDWDAYLLNPANIPTDCVVAGPRSVPTRAPSVTVFDPHFAASHAWRGSLGVQKRFGLYSLSANINLARGVNQSGFRDLNLADTPRFMLVNEGGRPVFAPAASIDRTTGAVGLLASRQHDAFGQVLSLESNLGSRSAQLTLSGNGVTQKGILFNLSYTWSRAEDQSSFSGGGGRDGFGAATTAGDPNVPEWGTSDFERKHSILSTVTYPLTGNLELTSIARMTSGSLYTPRVGSDINGDGARNDRSFIFDPASAPDTVIATGMQRLLDVTSGGARSCLENQMGAVAGRNSCAGPWRPSLDLQMNWRPDILGLSRRLMVSLTTVSLLSGIDQLVHGQDNLRGWGQNVRPDATLLYVTGFDPVTQRYLYTVNERFGSSRNAAQAFSQPFQLGIQLRYTIGPDRQRQFLDGLRGGGGGGGGRGGFGGGDRGGPGGGAFGPGGEGVAANFLSRFENLVPNPAKEILELRLGLRLNAKQVQALTLVSDSLTQLNRVLADSAQRVIEKGGANPNPASLLQSLRPLLQQGSGNLAGSLTRIQGILTPEQWNQVPERIKTPPRFGGQGGGQRPGGRPAERP